MIMKPATISFASAKGPSVTPEAVRTLPEGFSLLPISRILALNFSFHPLKAANISCICAGEGLFWLGAPRYMQRYFWVGIGFSRCCCALSGRHPRDARRGANRTLERFFLRCHKVSSGMGCPRFYFRPADGLGSARDG